MFSDCPLLALLETADRHILIQRIAEDQTAQAELNRAFSAAVVQFQQDKTGVPFTGTYTPQPDDREYLTIDSYALPEEFQSALQNPQGLEVYLPTDGELPRIKALLMGTCTSVSGQNHFTVALQKFKNTQYLTAAKHHLFFSGDTFRLDPRVGLVVAPTIDCYFEDGQLQFTSFYYARQILDLANYYRKASDRDIQDFFHHHAVQAEDPQFLTTANTWERRKIASILDSGVFQTCPPAAIQQIAADTGLTISMADNKILLPADKAERHLLLAFLDEEVYKGAFSQTVFQTNSKRKAK